MTDDEQKVFSEAWIQARREGHTKYSTSDIARKAVEAFRAKKGNPRE